MFGIAAALAMVAAALIAEQLEKESEYREPEGKVSNRYM